MKTKAILFLLSAIILCTFDLRAAPPPPEMSTGAVSFSNMTKDPFYHFIRTIKDLDIAVGIVKTQDASPQSIDELMAVASKVKDAQRAFLDSCSKDKGLPAEAQPIVLKTTKILESPDFKVQSAELLNTPNLKNMELLSKLYLSAIPSPEEMMEYYNSVVRDKK